MAANLIQLLSGNPSDSKGFAQSLALGPSWARRLVLFLKTQDNAADAAGDACEIEDIRKSQDGDEDAFRRLIERHQGHLAKLLWRFTRDQNSHEELLQESFVQAYLSLHSYKAHAPFEHWLVRIATRVGYRFWKQAKRHAHVSLMDTDWQRLTAEQADPLGPEQAAELVHQLLSQLPPRDRLVLTLRYLEQCDVKETARRTGWTASLVKVQTHRAKQKLQKLLENTDIEFVL